MQRWVSSRGSTWMLSSGDPTSLGARYECSYITGYLVTYFLQRVRDVQLEGVSGLKRVIIIDMTLQ